MATAPLPPLPYDLLETLPPVRTKASLVRDRLRAMIESRQLAPGDRVNVDAIARALGVSKIPVREAVKQLESEGLVVITPHAGARVAPVSRNDLAGLALLRETLEPLSAKLAAPKITREQLEELEAVMREMTAAQKAGALADLANANRAFHVGVARASGYMPVVQVIDDTLRRLRLQHELVLRPRIWITVLAGHRAILDALRARDATAAEEAARTHVRGRLAARLLGDPG